MLKDFVNNLVAQALDRAKEKGGLTLEVPPNIVIEEPRDESMGDFATTIAMQLAKSEKKNPKVIAEAIAEGIREQKEWVESVNVAGPGFINIKMNHQFYQERLKQVAALGGDIGKSTVGQNKKVLLEFVSANPTGQ